MRGLNEGRTARQEADVPPPVFEGAAGGARVGVVAGGFGSEALTQALREGGRYRAALVEGVALSAFRRCEALVLTQRRQPASLSKRHCWAFWEWVENGGRLLLTHDAVGYRDHPVLFPWVCTGGVGHVRRSTVRVVWHPEGEAPLGEVVHSYPDHILLKPCLRAALEVLAVDAESGEPVVSGAAFDRGRVVACGLALGVAPDCSEAPPQGGELRFLEVTLEWLLR